MMNQGYYGGQRQKMDPQAMIEPSQGNSDSNVFIDPHLN